jgi:hypothetical protein
MNIRTERRGLGRGLGELFQRTDTQPMSSPSDGDSEAPSLAPVPNGSYFTRAAAGLDLTESTAAAHRL